MYPLAARRLKTVFVALMLILASSPASAAWPADQPIKVIVPQAAGGTNDTVARLISVEVGKLLKQVVIVDNRPGAAGAIGMQVVAQAKPDGYTLGIASDSIALLDITRPNLSWKFKRDLQGVAMIGDQPICVAVPAQSAYMSFADVLKAAKDKPGSVAYATSGVGTSQHVVGEWLGKLAGVQLLHIPYKGGGQATTDIVGGQVPLAVLGLAPMLAQAKSGTVRILAVTSPKRVGTVPNVPTTTELGYAQLALTQWVGLVAPAGTPEGIVKQLSEAMMTVIARADIQQKLTDVGIDPKPLAYRQSDIFMKTNVDTWTRVVPSLNLKLD